MTDTSTIARPYARALFDIAKREGVLVEWAEALGVLAQIAADQNASTFLSRPDLDNEARADFIGAIGSEAGAAELVGTSRGQNFLRLLAENDRFSALPEIADRFNALKALAENTVKVTLITATKANTVVVGKISKALEKKLGRTVELAQKIDETLLGGAVVRAEDMVIDGSVKTRLQQLAATLTS